MNAEPALTQDTIDAAKLIGMTADAVEAASAFLDKARAAVSGTVMVDGRVSGKLLDQNQRSEEHTSELQSRETISYAVFCLKKKIL